MALGTNIRTARENLGISQEELGRRMDKAKSTICNWENDDNEPKISELATLAASLNTSIQFLLGIG